MGSVTADASGAAWPGLVSQTTYGVSTVAPKADVGVEGGVLVAGQRPLRVLRKDGIGFIHHPNVGAYQATSTPRDTLAHIGPAGTKIWPKGTFCVGPDASPAYAGC